MAPTDADADEVVRGEQALLDPAVRADRARVSDLLHPDFVEFGSSGQVWDRATIVASLAVDPGDAVRIATEVSTLGLGDDALLLTYRLSTSLRSSVWVRVDGRWLLRFHQGTPVPTAEDAPRVR